MSSNGDQQPTQDAHEERCPRCGCIPSTPKSQVIDDQDLGIKYLWRCGCDCHEDYARDHAKRPRT